MFFDIPWLNVPPHRQALITEVSLHPRGGLLGGASKGGKVSKLAALAAKRRQAQTIEPQINDENVKPADYVDRLKQLSVTRSATENTDPKPALDTSKDDSKMEIDSSEDRGAEEILSVAPSVPPPGQVHRLRAPPSAFAGIFANSSHSATTNDDTLLPVDQAKLTPTFDFNQPSPDDVFKTAQAKATR